MYLTESTNLLGWRAQEYAKNLSTKKYKLFALHCNTWNWNLLTATDSWCDVCPWSQNFCLNIINNANTQMCSLEMFLGLWIFHIMFEMETRWNRKQVWFWHWHTPNVFSFSFLKAFAAEVELGTHHRLCCTSEECIEPSNEANLFKLFKM